MAWHPVHESLFASGGAEGAIHFHIDNQEEPVGSLLGAHDGIVWSLDWHPLGHILASGSADCSARFWSRSRPGDTLRDKFTLGRQAAEALGIIEPKIVPEEDEEEEASLPGLGTQSQQYHQQQTVPRRSFPLRSTYRPSPPLPAQFPPAAPSIPSSGMPMPPPGMSPFPPGMRGFPPGMPMPPPGFPPLPPGMMPPSGMPPGMPPLPFGQFPPPSSQDASNPRHPREQRDPSHYTSRDRRSDPRDRHADPRDRHRDYRQRR